MPSTRLVLAVAAAVVLTPAAGSAQVTLAADRPAGACDAGDIAERLRREHPLHAAGSAAPCGEWTVWVPAAPLDRAQRLAWVGVSRLLLATDDAGCRSAGRLLEQVERSGSAMTWQAPDTSGGMVFYGAAFVDGDGTPLAIQMWEPAFDRPVSWLAGALAHEAFHALAPGAPESDAVAFGDHCAARAMTRVSARVTETHAVERFRRFLGPGAGY